MQEGIYYRGQAAANCRELSTTVDGPLHVCRKESTIVDGLLQAAGSRLLPWTSRRKCAGKNLLSWTAITGKNAVYYRGRIPFFDTPYLFWNSTP
ncbi:hypothetical protein [Flavobacterium kingsejongi]|uniref:hypothetical protein n=1 Tax=Flavobacterium kingsejongi TaxID=1678728 RepID=UPI0013004101|nr:hypothetical protein [Flavobacterium kingsejongi]